MCGSYGFPCPLGETSTIPSRIGSIIKWLLGFSGALFFAMFIWGGVLYLTAGTSKRTEEGTKTLVNAAIGLMIIALSYILVTRVMDFIGAAF